MLIKIILFLFLSSPAWATVYYTRDGGGTAAQCDGKTNHVLAGASGTNCAFSHPRYALGFNCGSNGSSCGTAGVLVAGDTLNINGDSDISPGTQAQYMIGYDSDGSGAATPGCNSAFPYDCTLGNIPAGTDASHNTSIIGAGTHKPQLWGNQRPWYVLYADNNHITIQWLEVTDHSNCTKDATANACNYSGSYPFGAWAEDGIFWGGDDVNMTDVYVHGLGRYGMNTDNFTNVTFTRVYVIGNGQAGISTGTGATGSGTFIQNQPIIDWNGCQEAYPISTLENPANYSNCFGQASGGYGDGLAFGNTGSGNTGNWTIIGPGSISFNTQDGLDTLHGTGNGNMNVDKMRFEGNAGNQIKMNGLNNSLTNSIIIGDCGWWFGATQSASGAMLAGDTCRALGDAVLFNVTNNGVTNIFNNTVLSNGNITLESKDINSIGCNGSTVIHEKNNIILGGYSWIDDTTFGGGGNSQTTYIYNAGNDGNGAGTCGTLTWDEDYNVVSGTKSSNAGCVGSNDKCGTAPGFSAGTFPMGTSGGAANTYYQGQSGITLVPISSGSGAKGTGVGGLTYWNSSSDYYSVAKASPPSMGAIEFGSSAANSYLCFFNSDCSSGLCTNNVCTSGVGDILGGNITIKGVTFK